MIVSCPFDAELSTELTERELAAEVSRSDRLLAARSLLKQCVPPTIARTVRVMEPYVDLDGRRRYWPVTRERLFLVSV